MKMRGIAKKVACWYNMACKCWENIRNGVTGMSTDIKIGKVNSVDFAIYLGKKARDRNLLINTTKLQKWLYICYGAYFAKKEEQLFNETPKAWQYGPVFPSVYNKQIKYGHSLAELADTIDDEALSVYDWLIEPILEHFGKWTAIQLVYWTHEKGKAWHKQYHMRGEKNVSMDNYDIMSDFRELVS